MIDWIIHCVANGYQCKCCNGNDEKNPSYYNKYGFANIHTHGLNKHNHRELCIVLDIGIERAGCILNAMGQRIAAGETTFSEGIRTDVLANGLPVEIISFDDDPTLYVLFPDSNGKLPGDDDCKSPYDVQEVYAKLISDNKDYI